MGNATTESQKRSERAARAAWACYQSGGGCEAVNPTFPGPGPDMRLCDRHGCVAVTRAGHRCTHLATFPDFQRCGVHVRWSPPPEIQEVRDQIHAMLRANRAAARIVPDLRAAADVIIAGSAAGQPTCVTVPMILGLQAIIHDLAQHLAPRVPADPDAPVPDEPPF